MTARQIRRAEEHKARKLAYKAAKAQAAEAEAQALETHPCAAVESHSQPESHAKSHAKSHPLSPAQLAANRANAAHSTGPKTEFGKAISSQNSFHHGLTGQFRFLAWEDQSVFNHLAASLVEEHQPATPTEHILVERMAQHLFLSQRAQTFQTEFLADDKKFALFLRYQTTHDRGFHKCLADLLKLRAEKRKERLDEAAVCQRAEDSNKAFVSQQHKNAAELRKQAAEKRRAELHPWKVLRADAEAEHRLLLNLNLGSPESPRTDLPERILRAESAAQQAAA